MERTMEAKPTIYKGIPMRSRLESRWAIVFDCLDIKWLYEPVGFKLGNYQYVPDFLLVKQDIFVEIKPKMPDGKELEKIIRLAEFHEIWLIVGMPGVRRTSTGFDFDYSVYRPRAEKALRDPFSWTSYGFLFEGTLDLKEKEAFIAQTQQEYWRLPNALSGPLGTAYRTAIYGRA